MMRIGLSDAFVCVPVFREYPCSVSGCGDVFAAAFCLQTDRQRLMMSSAFFAARQRPPYSARMRAAADFIIYRKRYIHYEFEYMERKNLSIFNCPDYLPVRFLPGSVRDRLVYYTDKKAKASISVEHAIRPSESMINSFLS